MGIEYQNEADEEHRQEWLGEYHRASRFETLEVDPTDVFSDEELGIQ